MILVVGQRFAGSVERVGKTHVVTEFFHVMWLPVVPLRSLLLLDRGGHQIPMHFGSVIAGYGRAWAPVVCLLVWLCALPWIVDHFDGSAQLFVVLASALLGTCVASLPHFAIGRLSRPQRAARLAFAKFLGAPVDPIASGASIPALREAALAKLEASSVASYRSPTSSGRERASVLQAALSSDDPEVLEAAVVLARIDEDGHGGGRPRLYEALAEKLASVSPRPQ